MLAVGDGAPSFTSGQAAIFWEDNQVGDPSEDEKGRGASVRCQRTSACTVGEIRRK